jgi:regulatory protein
MAGTITALRFQKRNKDRVNVYVDGQFAFGLAAILAAPLRVGQTLGEEDLGRLETQDDVERAYERALNFLSYRPRSQAEVRRNLRKKKLEDSVVEAALDRLIQAGLLDDREFVRYWVENRVQFNPRGIRALRQELWQRGVPGAIIDDELAGFDEEPSARRVAEAGARRFGGLAPRQFREKLGAYLARRGFSYAVVTPLVQEMLETVHSSASPEIESEENAYG